MISLKRLVAIGLIALMLFAAVPAAAQTSGNIYQMLQKDSSFSKMVSLLHTTNQDRSLIVAGPFTILAPTNDAFNKLSPLALQGLMSGRLIQSGFARNSMISGKYTTDQLVSMGYARTLDGRRLPVTRASDGSVMIGGAKVVKPNIAASNGIIQGVDAIIIPS
jgi:uncharacterized surface protein with fasciclin (FAS1) repeats